MSRSLLLAAALALPLAGCTGLQKRDFRPLVEERYPPRETPAEISRTPEAELRARGYLLIGVAEVRQELRRCEQHGCIDQTYPEDATTQARRIAADNGGDLIALEKDNAIEKEPYEQFGPCKVPIIHGPASPSQVTPLSSGEDCLEYEKIRGVKEIRVSQGFVWRLEPAAAGNESGRLGKRLFPDQPKEAQPPDR